MRAMNFTNYLRPRTSAQIPSESSRFTRRFSRSSIINSSSKRLLLRMTLIGSKESGVIGVGAKNDPEYEGSMDEGGTEPPAMLSATGVGTRRCFPLADRVTDFSRGAANGGMGREVFPVVPGGPSGNLHCPFFPLQCSQAFVLIRFAMKTQTSRFAVTQASHYSSNQSSIRLHDSCLRTRSEPSKRYSG
jgi:hypothetical protein